MSGKFAKKKKSSRGSYILVLLVVLALLAGFWVMDMLAQRDQEQMPLPTDPEETTLAQTEPVTGTTVPEATLTQTEPVTETAAPETTLAQTEPVTETTAPEATAAPTAPEAADSFTLEQGIEILRYGKYMGLYMEDGSDDFVTDVLMIQITNTGDDAIRYGTIRLSGEAGEAVFNFTTLKPGDTMVVLEAERKAFADGDVYTEAVAENVAWFDFELSRLEDQLQIQPLDGGFNVINISGEDITGEITIYYKDVAAGVYYGGITYVCRIPDGMKKDEIRQFMTENFSKSGSEIVFVRIAP